MSASSKFVTRGTLDQLTCICRAIVLRILLIRSTRIGPKSSTSAVPGRQPSRGLARRGGAAAGLACERSSWRGPMAGDRTTAKTSSRVIRPPSPLPTTRLRSTPTSRAKRRIAGPAGITPVRRTDGRSRRGRRLAVPRRWLRRTGAQPAGTQRAGMQRAALAAGVGGLRRQLRGRFAGAGSRLRRVRRCGSGAAGFGVAGFAGAGAAAASAPRGFHFQDHTADRNGVSFADEDLCDLTTDRRRNGNGRFVRFHFDDVLAGADHITDGDKDFQHIARFDAVTKFGKFYFGCHVSLTVNGEMRCDNRGAGRFDEFGADSGEVGIRLFGIESKFTDRIVRHPSA